MNDILVLKCDHAGREVFRYEGEVLQRDADVLCLRAVFAFDDVEFDCVTFSAAMSSPSGSTASAGTTCSASRTASAGR